MFAALMVVGAGLRLALILATPGAPPDIDVLVRVAGLALHDPLDVYDLNLSGSGDIPVWPYPSAYFPVLAGAQAFSELFGIAPHRAVRLPPALADLGLALLARR